MFYDPLSIDRPAEMRENFGHMRRLGIAGVIAAVLIAGLQLQLYTIGAGLDMVIVLFDAALVLMSSIVFRYSVVAAQPWFETALAWRTAAHSLEHALNAKIVENEELRHALARHQ